MRKAQKANATKKLRIQNILKPISWLAWNILLTPCTVESLRPATMVSLRRFDLTDIDFFTLTKYSTFSRGNYKKLFSFILYQVMIELTFFTRFLSLVIVVIWSIVNFRLIFHFFIIINIYFWSVIAIIIIRNIFNRDEKIFEW